MSNILFDLKGVDTSKVGNNKYVNYTFKDYMDDFGLNREGAEKNSKSENIFLKLFKQLL